MCQKVRKSLPAVAILVLACSPNPAPIPPPDAFGCQPPPPDVFTKAGVDLDVAKSTFGDVVVGAVDIKTSPEVVSLASRAVTDLRIRAYLRCLAVKQTGYSLEQADYFDSLAAFMSTGPTADQMLEWKRSNPFPGEVPRRNSLRLLIRTEEPIPGAVITISGTSGTVGTAIAGPERETRIEIPEEFKGTEIEVRIEMEGYMTSSKRIVAKDGAVATFDVEVP